MIEVQVIYFVGFFNHFYEVTIASLWHICEEHQFYYMSLRDTVKQDPCSLQEV